MTDRNLTEEKWYIYLKKKYKLSDDDMEEYIESFDLINKGNDITADVLQKFIYGEIYDQWSKYECGLVIMQINKQLIDNTTGMITNRGPQPRIKNTLDLQGYLSYIIPICHDYVVTRIGIRELFDSLDTNLDGRITCTELISLL